MPAWRRKGNCHILEVESALPLKATPRIPLGVTAGGGGGGGDGRGGKAWREQGRPEGLLGWKGR